MPYDYNQPRILIGTRIAGDVESELSYYPEDPRAIEGRRALSQELSILRKETHDGEVAGTSSK